MGVSDAVWRIETAIADTFDRFDQGIDRQQAHCRRSAYEQILVDVDRQGGTEAMYTLADWIEREIRAANRLPSTHEVRQVGNEICRYRTSAPAGQ
ncbi:hypothetical protein [Halohasta salina]|uniref:hypothetical protein n=1 Tax=Halohasta salina TaxID=2961621 RepID=UPI0020A2D236|nr:hypothetical protein [Halohasta salina]